MVENKKRVKSSSLLVKMNLRTILHSKLQFLAVILITLLAMTLYVGLTSNAKSINDRVDNLYEDGNIADLWVNTTKYDENDIKEIKDIVKDNGEVEGRFVLPGKLQTYEATALMSEKLPTINKPAITDNTEIENFFIIDERLLESHDNPTSTIRWYDENGNYLKVPVSFSIASYINMLKNTKIGTFDGKERSYYDAITICLKDGKENILDDPYLTLDLQITGTMTFSENIQNSQMNNSSFLLSVNYFKNEFLNLIKQTYASPVTVTQGDADFEFKSFLKYFRLEDMMPVMIDNGTKPNQYVTKLVDNTKTDETLDSIKTYFDNKEEKNLLMCTSLDALFSNITIQNDIVQARQLAYIFPIIFFLVAILVVLTTISQIIIKDRIQIGTMKALGISTGKVIVHYMALSIYIVLIGILFGIFIGPFIIPMIMNQKYDLLYTLPKIKFTLAIPEMLLSTVIVLLITSLVTFMVVRKEAKLKPTEGMRPKEIKITKVSKNTNKKITRKSIPFRMAIRNIKLNFAKSLMVVIGVAGCTALLVCGFGIDDTLDHGIDNDTMYFYNSDIYANYSSNESNLENISKVEGIKEVEEYTYLPTLISFNEGTYQTFVTVVDDNSKFFKFNDYTLTDEIIISNKVAKNMNIKVGDTIDFSSVGLNFKGKVGLILDTFYMHGIYINSGYNDYDKLGFIKTNAWINAKDGTNHDLIVEELNNLHGISNAKTKEKSIDLIDSYMSSISLMTLAVKVFAILLAIVVLYNLTLLNFKERQRDVATLKVLGFSKNEISNSLFFESMILTIAGVIVGLFLGLPMEILVLIVNQTPLVEFLYTVFPISYVFSFVLTIGTAMFVNWILGFKIKKIKMVESLKSVE